jgi:periplasmic divalent cation tolerance protein
MSDARFVYITAANRADALKIGRACVEARLAACANVFDGVSSVYWWQGKLTEDSEAILVMKSRAPLIDALVARIKDLHSYTVPCVVALPIVAGNPQYLAWIAQEATGETA